MSKDPAFLFYSADFYMGTVGMTDAQVGKYIRLLCLQHQQGKLTEAMMTSVMGKEDPVILSKFVRDDDGRYYNERLYEETQRRTRYSESRRKNRTMSNKKSTDGNTHEEDMSNKKSTAANTHEEDMMNICQSHDEHMETETETETVTVNKEPSTRTRNRNTRHKYGEYQNVLLSDDELAKLQAEFVDWRERIERLSAYIASKGAKYKSHLATIRNWARNEKPKTAEEEVVGWHL